MRNGFFVKSLMAAALLALPCNAVMAATATVEKEQNLVDRATLAVRDIFSGAKSTSKITRYLAQARGVIVCPSVFRMSIAFGGGSGGCVLLTRDARGSWSDPAFYTIATANFGLQLGMQDAEIMMFVMTDTGVQSLLDSQFKFGADAGTSFASSGSGIESGTAGSHNTDIMGVQKSKGLFAGAALGGSKLKVNSPANRAYYSQVVGPEDIVISMRVNNPGADPLRSALSEVLTAAQANVPAGATATTTNSQPVVQPAQAGQVHSQDLPSQ